jgi:RHS repeat-associated protein
VRCIRKCDESSPAHNIVRRQPIGQVVDKKLHNTTGTNYLQSVDYRYTIKGQLQSINNAELQTDASNDEATDYFGMELLYNETDTETSLSTTSRYDGNISAIKWKGIGAGQGTTDQRSYKYNYDKVGRLETANSQVKGSTSWSEQNALNENMTYDHNGNIQKLVRKQGKRGLLSGDPTKKAAVIMDSLTYGYGTSNRNALLKVDDGSNAEGFKNGTNSGDDFTYDNSGNVISDKNKGMDSIKYNVFGKVVRIKFSNGKVIKYTYDAAGTKLTMKTYSGDTLKTTTEYANGFVYENNTLAFFGAPEGRVVNASGTLYHEYSIADHQGNTRVVFTSNTPAADEPLATFEGDANDKSGQYVNTSTNIVSFSSANHTAGGSKVVRMNSTYKFGPAKSVRVYPGDKIDMEVWEYHEGSSGFGTSSPSLSTVITNVAGLFGGVSAGAGESGLIYEGFNDGLTVFGTGANQGDTRPAAYLNYVLFDNNYKVVDAGWQLAPATTFTKQKLSFPTKTIKDAGYIYVWLSYEDESTNWVYFDDLKVTHTKTNVVQYNEYYPFGLQTENSWTRNGNKNDYLYNEGSQLNPINGWYETAFRGYDPALGRFLQIDPLATLDASVTPFAYGGNNPAYFNDPLGLMISASGYTEGQMRAMYRAQRDNYSSYEAWATDNVDGYYGGGSGFTIDAKWVSVPNSRDGGAGHYSYGVSAGPFSPSFSSSSGGNEFNSNETSFAGIGQIAGLTLFTGDPKAKGSRDGSSGQGRQQGERSITGFAATGWSVGGTAAIGTIGLNIQLGVVDDGKWPMAFFSLNHAVGIDLSIEAGVFTVHNNNPNKPFEGSNFAGPGGSYNLGGGPVSYSYGGDSGANGAFPNNYTVNTLGLAASPTPVSLSVYHGKTWTWPTIPYIGLLLPRF